MFERSLTAYKDKNNNMSRVVRQYNKDLSNWLPGSRPINRNGRFEDRERTNYQPEKGNKLTREDKRDISHSIHVWCDLVKTSGNLRCFFLQLLDFCNASAETRVSQNTLAARCRISCSTVMRYIKRLSKADIIIVSRSGWRATNHIKIDVQKLFKLSNKSIKLMDNSLLNHPSDVLKIININIPRVEQTAKPVVEDKKRSALEDDGRVHTRRGEEEGTEVETGDKKPKTEVVDLPKRGLAENKPITPSAECVPSRYVYPVEVARRVRLNPLIAEQIKKTGLFEDEKAELWWTLKKIKAPLSVKTTLWLPVYSQLIDHTLEGIFGAFNANKIIMARFKTWLEEHGDPDNNEFRYMTPEELNNMGKTGHEGIDLGVKPLEFARHVREGTHHELLRKATNTLAGHPEKRLGVADPVKSILLTPAAPEQEGNKAMQITKSPDPTPPIVHPTAKPVFVMPPRAENETPSQTIERLSMKSKHGLQLTQDESKEYIQAHKLLN